MSPRRKSAGHGKTESSAGLPSEPTVLSKMFVIELARTETGAQIETQCVKAIEAMYNRAKDKGHKIGEIKLLATKADTSLCLTSTNGELEREARIGWESITIQRFDMFFSAVVFGPTLEDLEDTARSIIAYELNATF